MTARALLALLDPCAVGNNPVHSVVLGATHWFDRAGDIHRDGGPAIIYANGETEWYRHGVLHRIDGPAVSRPRPAELLRVECDPAGYAGRDAKGVPQRRSPLSEPGLARLGTDAANQVLEEWWRDGVRHRTDGPAVTYADGVREWWRGGVRHRADGPAVEYPRPYGDWAAGPDEYWVDGSLHCVDGAALRRFTPPGSEPTRVGSYYLLGTEVSYARWKVLRGLLPGLAPTPLAPSNVAAWQFLEDAGAIEGLSGKVDEDALRLATSLHPNV